MIKPSIFKLLFRSCQRGELNLLIVSLIMSVAIVTCISIFTDRIKHSMLEESAALMAGDAQIKGSIKAPEQWLNKLSDMHINYSQTVSFRSMSFGQQTQMTSVRALPDNFPLKGYLLIADNAFGQAKHVSHGPAPGEAWINSRLFSALGVEIGESIDIGKARFKVTQALIQEPGDTSGFFGVAPRVLIHKNSVANTDAIKPGSRVNYALLLAGDRTNIDAFKAWATPKLGNHFRWLDSNNSNRGVSSALDKAQQFFLLAGCLGVILSGAAISLAASRYARSLNTGVALLKTFGLRPQIIVLHFIIALCLIGLICVVIGSFLGWSLHWVMIKTMGDLIPITLQAATLSAYTIGMMTGFISLIAFALPPIAQLRKLSPLTILKSDIDTESSVTYQFVTGFIAVLILVYVYSQSVKLTLIISFAAIVCLVSVTLISRFILKSLAASSKYFSHTWRLGITSLYRHRSFNSIQASVFSVLLMLLFVLVLARTSLIEQWQSQLPDNAPNHFLFNVFIDEKNQIEQFLNQNQVSIQKFYPMNAGRVIKVNNIPIKKLIKENQSNINYKRELNLSWSDKPGIDNNILKGLWWPDNPDDSLQVSAEQRYAEGLNLQLGDKLTFSVAGQEFDAKLASIRSVKWDSMNPNFYMLFNKEFLNSSGANWLTSFHLPESKKLFVNKLLKQFPSVTIIEMDQTIKQIQSIMSNVSMAVEFILVLVLGSGILLLITCVQATLDTRKQESTIIRALGGSKNLIRQRLLIEFGLLGLISGIIGLIGAEISLFYLAEHIFDLQFGFHWHLWWSAPLVGTLLIGVTGWLSVKQVINTSPLKALRQT